MLFLANIKSYTVRTYHLRHKFDNKSVITKHESLTWRTRRRGTWRWNKKSGIPFKTKLEAGPCIDIPLLWELASFRHSCDNLLAKNVIPHVEITQESLKWLCAAQATSNRILLLTQHQRSPRSDHVGYFKVCRIRGQHTIFEEVHRTSGVFQWYTNVMPFVVISWHR